MARQFTRKRLERAVGPADERLTRRAVLGATIGNILEFYDFATYSFFAIQIGQAFFPATNQFASLMLSLGTFGAGFVTRPIGAIVLGSYSDRAGRRPAMTASFALMSVAVLLLAITPSYETIGLAAPLLAIFSRLLQGFALGGEVGPTTAYLMEAAPVKARGLAVSFQPASQQVAATAGALVGEILSLTMTSEALNAYGWRIALLLGAATLPFGLWLRSVLPETLHRPEAPVLATQPVRRSPAARRIISFGFVILASCTINAYVTGYMTTYALNTLHVSAPLAFGTTLISSIAGIAAALLGGLLADRAGRRRIMIWPQAAALLMTYPVFLWIAESRSALALLGGLGALTLIGTIPYGAFFVSMVESLPRNIRGGAFATIYAFAIAIFGGTAQPIVTWLIYLTGSALAPAWYMLLASAAGLFAMLMMPETAPLNCMPNHRRTSTTPRPLP
ncbi:citrate:proton symporter [Bradyrhizobium sacchari]|uniref:Putative MFS family arabinose efflux permease n=1 Tax=Bradyrhizobium sacchari TaxID=1399419 RepID=A0A560JE42_9BRAD|nr:MFS transporter [Bradyrhizobium sacchari]OPY96037.1 citrate:proton symporter [Bradyrhizobium sacchari]TWB51239.1 putative MFS family arabinose efflux permease [Bradyrhizobium sacchari]TWB69473.1 putative MFS family arabinose efflux permease [Bradyrhizobium sacchari]